MTFPTETAQRPLIWFPGVGWDETRGTDRRIVEEIAKTRTVVWIDPPNRRDWPGWWRGEAPAVERMNGVIRLRVPATVGVTRWPTRLVTDFLRRAALQRALRVAPTAVVVVANPLVVLPRTLRSPVVLYATDDWVEGADLMGLSKELLLRNTRRLSRVADAIAAVSKPLLDLVVRGPIDEARHRVVPNGAPSVVHGGAPERGPFAVLMGQLNERIDVSLLEAVVDAGVPLRVVGPLLVKDPDAEARMTALLNRPGVDWRGSLPPEEVVGHLRAASVGLTPYTLTPFNRMSSPLKTFDYLAAGTPVVSSNLPASAWFDSQDVVVATDRTEFVDAVGLFVATRGNPDREHARLQLARRNSWAARASEMGLLADSLPHA